MSTKAVEMWIHPKDDDSTIELHISRERLALALIREASETAPIVLHEAWANGDSAKVIVRRIPWRETEWRLTTQGWIKGPYRVWCDGAMGARRGTVRHGYYVECAPLVDRFRTGPFINKEDAMRAAMEHADKT